jgi:hypothetical protein
VTGSGRVTPTGAAATDNRPIVYTPGQAAEVVGDPCDSVRGLRAQVDQARPKKVDLGAHEVGGLAETARRAARSARVAWLACIQPVT